MWRPLTAQLLLCSLLTTAAAQVKCDRSLIKGVTDAQIQFDSATKRLTCVRSENNLMMIHLHLPVMDKITSMPHEFISCDEVVGWQTERMYPYWTNINYGEHKIADASATLTIACVEYCASTGAPMRFEKMFRDNVGQAFDDNPTTLLRAYSADEKCDIYFGWRKVNLPASCDPYSGWHDENGYLITSERRAPQRFEYSCKGAPPPPCIVELPDQALHIFEYLEIDPHTGTLTCRFIDGIPRRIVYPIPVSRISKSYDSLVCDGESWTGTATPFQGSEGSATTAKIRRASYPLRIACQDYVPINCNRELIRIHDAENKIKFDGKTLECIPKPNALMMIRYKEKDGSNSPPHASLSCDSDGGWTTKEITPFYGTNKDDPRYEAHKFAESYALLHVECVEYCASTGSGFAVNPKAHDKLSLLGLNVDKGRCNLYYEWRSVGNLAYCSPYSGWYNIYNVLVTREVTVAQPFVGTCKGAPPPPCAVMLKSYNTMHNFRYLNVDIATRTLTCRDKSDSFPEVKFDSKLYPSLECDEARGWTSKQSRLEDGTLIAKEEWVASSSSMLEIDCEPICAASGSGIIFTKSGENAEVGCADGHKLLFGNTFISSAKCSSKSGTWTLFTETFKEFHVRLKVDLECRPICPEPPITTGAHFDSATKTLTCDSADDSLMAIEFNSDLYTSLTCDDFGGWKGVVHENKTRNLASTSARINFACVKYCVTAYRGLTHEVSHNKTKISVKCKQEGARIIYDAKPIYDVVCDLQSGWQSKVLKLIGDTSKPLDVYCEAPRPNSADPLVTTRGPQQAAQAQSASSVVVGLTTGVVLAIIVAVAVVIFVVFRKRKRRANSEKGADGKAGKRGNEKSDANVVSSG